MEKSLKAKIVIAIDRVEIYQIIDNTKKHLSKGDLKIMQLKKEQIYIMTIGDFSYSLSKELAVMRSTHDQYVFPHLDGFIGIVIPENVNYQYLEAFEALLQETTDFTISRDRQTVHDIKRSMTFDLEAAQGANKISKSRKISMFLENSSEHVKRGLVRAATFTSVGIKLGSEYLKTKIKPKTRPSVVTEKQNATIEHLKTVSSMALVLSKAVVTGTIATTKEIGN